MGWWLSLFVVAAGLLGFTASPAAAGQYTIRQYHCLYKHPTPAGPITFFEEVSYDGLYWNGYRATWRQEKPSDRVRLEVEWSSLLGAPASETFVPHGPAWPSLVAAWIDIYFETPKRIPKRSVVQIGGVWANDPSLVAPLNDERVSNYVHITLRSLRGFMGGSLAPYEIRPRAKLFTPAEPLYRGQIDLRPVDVVAAELAAGHARFRELTKDFRKNCTYHEYEATPEDTISSNPRR